MSEHGPQIQPCHPTCRLGPWCSALGGATAQPGQLITRAMSLGHMLQAAKGGPQHRCTPSPGATAIRRAWPRAGPLLATGSAGAVIKQYGKAGKNNNIMHWGYPLAAHKCEE
ncbi:hypothetical protein AAFF_G00170410 [Aldrovandia affinis]|uniref:Uncharacterized protein n=1 Tax=Aldrovandia affinis TaxID=143900 RepID=A0AAD7W868_9TELE|nr:hypothetical protein AAFF_G00170410 [Aldrovandia affinis]